MAQFYWILIELYDYLTMTFNAILATKNWWSFTFCCCYETFEESTVRGHMLGGSRIQKPVISCFGVQCHDPEVENTLVGLLVGLGLCIKSLLLLLSFSLAGARRLVVNFFVLGNTFSRCEMRWGSVTVAVHVPVFATIVTSYTWSIRALVARW